MCDHAPIELRKCAEAGVSELQRLENLVEGRENEAVCARSWASMRAMRRPDVIGLEPRCFPLLTDEYPYEALAPYVEL